MRSYEMSLSLFVWRPINLDSNATDYFYETYYKEEFTPANLALGTTSAAFDFCSILQGEMIRDMILLAATLLLGGWELFEAIIQPQLLVHSNQIPSNLLTKALELYNFMRLGTECVNHTFSTLFKLVVMQNLFQYAYMFVLLLSVEDQDMKLVKTSVDLLKASLTFYIALRIHRKVGRSLLFIYYQRLSQPYCCPNFRTVLQQKFACYMFQFLEFQSRQMASPTDHLQRNSKY